MMQLLPAEQFCENGIEMNDPRSSGPVSLMQRTQQARKRLPFAEGNGRSGPSGFDVDNDRELTIPRVEVRRSASQEILDRWTRIVAFSTVSQNCSAGVVHHGLRHFEARYVRDYTICSASETASVVRSTSATWLVADHERAAAGRSVFKNFTLNPDGTRSKAKRA